MVSVSAKDGSAMGRRVVWFQSDNPLEPCAVLAASPLEPGRTPTSS